MSDVKTIDGVPRKMLTALLCKLGEFNNRALADELRALLDAKEQPSSAIGHIEQRRSMGLSIGSPITNVIWDIPQPELKNLPDGAKVYLHPVARPGLGRPEALEADENIECMSVRRSLLSDLLVSPGTTDGRDARFMAQIALRALLDAPARSDYLQSCEAAHKTLEPAAQPRGEPIYQLEYLGEGGGGWNEVDKDTYDRFERLPNYRPRIVYTEQPPQATVTLGVKEVGNYGKLYDGPAVRRAYTYKHKPGNDAAYSIGLAAMIPGGSDSIDNGLRLLMQLERAGYGVFAL